ncbi:MAG: DNA replication and repair protein RecF, partial [Verrucomicrobiota bacterium]
QNLRCFPSFRCSFGPGVTAFVGNNAQGKTSILEAICLAMRLQSPRTSRLGDVLRFDTTQLGLSSTYADQELRFTYEKKRRKLSVDGELLPKSSSYLAASGLIVWMANDDLLLIRGDHAGRRRFLDFVAAQLFPTYRPALRAYERALKARNFLLKRDASPPWDEIDAYGALLADHAAVLTECRQRLVEKLQPACQDVQHHIGGGTEVLHLHYQPAGGADLQRELRDRREEEARRRSTLRGPHRDELDLHLDGRRASQFASEGQQRTLALALKLGQARVLLAETEKIPLLLLDDIFGELDPHRRHALLEVLPPQSQKFLTTTTLDWLEGTSCTPNALYRVQEGTTEPA